MLTIYICSGAPKPNKSIHNAPIVAQIIIEIADKDKTKTNKILYAGKLNQIKLNVLGVIEKNELKLEVKDKNNYCLHYDAHNKRLPNVSEDNFPNSVNSNTITFMFFESTAIIESLK